MRSIVLALCLASLCASALAVDLAPSAEDVAAAVDPAAAAAAVAAAQVPPAEPAPTAGEPAVVAAAAVAPELLDAAATIPQPPALEELPVPTEESAAAASAAAAARGAAYEAEQAAAGVGNPAERRRQRRSSRKSGTGVVSAQNAAATIIPYNIQCGGRSTTTYNGWPGCQPVPGSPRRECWDAPWSGVQCTAGTVCTRSNEWWWYCNWGAPTTTTQVVLPAWVQCGGRSTTTTNGWPGCGSPSPSRECADRAWSGTTCRTGHSCQRDNEWWWSCKPSTTPPPPSPPPALPQPQPSNGCPAGWLPAIGTLYDSWPKPGTTECVQYSGCKWAGLFSRLSAGPLFSPLQACNPASCLSTTVNGVSHRAQCLAGDQRSFEVACRWPEASVRSWKMAATWDRDPALLNSNLEVMVQGNTARTARVRVMDVCNDNDCAGCCSRNSANGRYKLIDLEKWAALDLLNFDPSPANFDINNVQKPAAGALRPGAEGMMPLCYRVV